MPVRKKSKRKPYRPIDINSITKFKDRTSIDQLMRFLDYVYKRGVEDASLVNDDFALQEYLDRRKDPDTFGFLDTAFDIDWREFRFVVTRWAFQRGQKTLAEKYLMKISKADFKAVSLAAIQDFYLLGVEHWMGYRNPMKIEVFKQRRNVHWDLVRGKSFTPFKKEERVSILQERMYDRIHRAEAKNESWLSKSAYEIFSSEIWKLTRPLLKEVPGDY